MSVKIRSKKLSKGTESLYLDIYNSGTRHYEFLNIKITPKDKNKQEKRLVAENIRAMRELELISKGSTYIPKHLKDIDFSLFASQYLCSYRCKDVRMIQHSIDKFKKCIQNDKIKISEITTVLMLRYKDYLIYDAGLTGETPHNYFTRFKKVLKSAKVNGYFDHLPTDDIKFSKPHRNDTIKKEILTAQEIQLLANTLCGNETVKRAFLFSCYTSLGLAEIKDLKWANIQNDRLRIMRKKTGEEINNRLTATALSFLGERRSRDKYIFDLQKISQTSVNKDIRHWTERAKIDKHITFYCGRHTFACLLLMAGANLKTVADAMGHSSTKSTLKYLNYVQKLQDDAIDRLPEIEYYAGDRIPR